MTTGAAFDGWMERVITEARTAQRTATTEEQRTTARVREAEVIALRAAPNPQSWLQQRVAHLIMVQRDVRGALLRTLRAQDAIPTPTERIGSMTVTIRFDEEVHGMTAEDHMVSARDGWPADTAADPAAALATLHALSVPDAAIWEACTVLCAQGTWPTDSRPLPAVRARLAVAVDAWRQLF
jgi:hypothetical protein